MIFRILQRSRKEIPKILKRVGELIKLTTMKKTVLILFAIIAIINTSCRGEKEDDPKKEACEIGIKYKMDGNEVSFPNSGITAEIYPNDPNVGKIYDIWTDDNVGFYFHSSVAEQGQTCGFVDNWLTEEGANIAAWTQMQDKNFTFTIDQEASAVGDNVKIKFSGSFNDNGTIHQITEGVICTTIDIVH